MPNWGAGAGGALTGAATGATVGSVLPGVGTAIGAGVGGLIGGLGGLFGGDDQAARDEAKRKQLLAEQAQQAGQFANQSQANYSAYGGMGTSALNALRAQAMGQNSVSAEQLRQGLQQNLAAQQSIAAGASPRNASMAGLQASRAAMSLGAGLAGQQSLAGIQERNAAWGQYGGLLQGLRGQDLQATLGSRQGAMTGYGAANAGTPAPSWLQQWGPGITGALGAYTQIAGRSGGAAPAMSAGGGGQYSLNGANFTGQNYMPTTPGFTFSDRALKTDIKPGDAAANKAIDTLAPYAYRYKDAQYGAGPQVGVMAQDLQRAGLGQAVVKTPVGLAIDPGKLSGANTALIAALGRRVSDLEDVAPSAPTARSRADDDAAASATLAQAQADAAAHARVRQQVELEQADPAAAAAQYALNARRWLLTQPPGSVSPAAAAYASTLTQRAQELKGQAR